MSMTIESCVIIYGSNSIGRRKVEGTRLGDRVEYSGDTAFAVGPGDVAGWLPEGRVVLEEVGVDQSTRQGSVNGRQCSFITTPIDFDTVLYLRFFFFSHCTNASFIYFLHPHASFHIYLPAACQ